MRQIAEGSKIIDFCRDLNKNFILFFYESAIYKVFTALNRFFKNTVLKSANESVFVNTGKKIARRASLGGMGLFFVLVVIFNTTAMVALSKNIDIFSICARVFFLVLGMVLMWWRRA